MRFFNFFIAGIVAAGFASALQPRSFVDTCASVNTRLVVKGVHFGHIRASCLCISGLKAFVATNPHAKAAAKVFGSARVIIVLRDIILHGHHSVCKFPDHSVPNCKGHRGCGFDCKHGFVKFHDRCVHAPSPSAHKIKRDLNLDSDQKCDFGYTKCGVYDMKASRTGFECINVKTSLESCGGCTMAFGTNPANGVDCTAIPGVGDVACEGGLCVIHTCSRGWLLGLGSDGVSTTCVEAPQSQTTF